LAHVMPHLVGVAKERTLSEIDVERLASHDDANVPQLLNLLNGFVEERLLTQTQAVLRREMLRARLPARQITAAYMGILSREPESEELSMWLRIMRSDPRQGTKDLIWTLINTHEFLFVR